MKTSSVCPAFVIACVVAIQATFSPAQETATPKASASPGDVNLSVSRVYVFVDKTGLGHQHAIEGTLASGSMMLGAQAQCGQLVFDIKSFEADTAAARKYIGLQGTTNGSTRKKVNDNMRGSHVLDVDRYPTATFNIASAKPTGKNSKKGLPTYELVGSFTLHGVKRLIQVIAEVEQARGWLHVRGSFPIKQTSYGITPYSKAFGAIGVADDLRIHGDFWVAPNEHIWMAAIPERN